MENRERIALKIMLLDTALRTVFLVALFNLLLTAWLFSKDAGLGLIGFAQPLIAWFAMLLAVPWEKRHRILGYKYYGFVVFWLVLTWAVLLAGVLISRRDILKNINSLFGSYDFANFSPEVIKSSS